MRPHQIISLMDLGGPSFPLPDHWDHIHVGFYPRPGDINYNGAGAGVSSTGSRSAQLDSLLKPDQWKRLIGRIATIHNPHVPTSPSKYSVKTQRRGTVGRSAHD